MFLPHRLKRPITVGIALIFHLFGAEHKMRIGCDGTAHHLDTLCILCPSRPVPLMWRISGRKEPDFIKPELLVRRLAKDQMTDMNGIECASHNANFSVFLFHTFSSKSAELQRYAPVPAVLPADYFGS